MKKIIFICFSLLALTAGCSMSDNEKSSINDDKTEAVKPKDMDPKDLPQVPAFQDEKTREYIVSTKEAEPGYYLLESKLKEFRMLFPENAKYLARRSSLTGKNKESIGFNSYDKDTNVMFDGHVTYYKEESFVNESETMLDIVSGKNDYKGEYKKSSKKNKDIYFAKKKDIFDDIDRKYNDSYSYFGYVKSTEEDNLGVEYAFTFGCKNEIQPCSLDEEKAKNKVEKLINSINFLLNKQNK
ncbi:lipoprotein YvcA [Bacillus mojavensis]|uniref:Lipoprotein YvcA n=1 Tax=Bacillus mojavensis TaxID=72360 RepID=A0AAP3CV56_BACMO|nr:lipoprotein YvcA [Bacillus mojavensis]MCY8106087.1 lipoprotein YvcA [Bacillus mojavensis]MCY8483060.1 lipoprotein YvcA [Bacillus mojavensis]MCY8511100.1 lipoprotein YvcA [Bacillus mojavensis]MEC1775579.1 lipoprotein YvcA [Bacillus mojavensis]